MKTILVDAVFCLVNNRGQLFQEMKKLLDTYPNRKIVLSGADDEQYKQFGLDRLDYEVFTLKHNPEKTDPSYYKTMLRHFNLSTKDVIYFEHGLEAVESAQSVGIETYHYDNEKKDLTALNNFIDSNL